MTPDGMSENALREGQWLRDDWAQVGSSRPHFISGVLERFCGPLMDLMRSYGCPEDELLNTEFIMGQDPTQLSIIDELIGTILGYNWANVGYLCCTKYANPDLLDSVSRREFVKARDFLENWIRAEGYQCLRLGSKSKLYAINLNAGFTWKHGILSPIERETPRSFYQIASTYRKKSVAETISKFEKQVWKSSNPMDFLRKVSQVLIPYKQIRIFQISLKRTLT